MLTKEEMKIKITSFEKETISIFTLLQDNIMLNCEDTNGTFLYKNCYSYMYEARKAFSDSLYRLLEFIPIIDTKYTTRCIDSITSTAQELRFANTSNSIINTEIQKLVDSIFEDAYYAKKELKTI